ncbi:tyrosyl-tRNA synthetase [Microsporum canis CBS 113480]|uniref:tyrosine--tRNA ligase n=1 Tax=Arthroderma otae (strain ATCC MYA-4605 / CBS 113480) TaxID=554155 RepID=C5FSP9_ARTOC|nr:tyrosyl-tRNA synthetase [Microsporum canis CBS 113480]EEQ32902.1 tyrosyl-tRNA synthetase [Microsporum canis CBS 113480]
MAEAEEQWEGWAKEIKEGKRQSFLSFMEERGLVHSVIGDRDVLDKMITNKRVGLYAGIDPTAPSMHVGHMLPFMVLGWAYVHGMKSVWLLGGSTSRVGDPTGRTTARPLLSNASRKAYIANMHMQLKKLGGTMLGREPVKTRLESGSGMSFTEFCYPIMQAWDWWHLYQKGITIQVGGSDQSGNIQFGIDTIKQILKTSPIERKPGEDPDLSTPIGLTVPLLTTSTGEKIGKSAGNSIWLDKDMTSTYDLYQYFMRQPDQDMERLLKLFTFIPTSRIHEIVEEHNKSPSLRLAQHTLAQEFVELIHGAKEAEEASKAHKAIFQPQSSTSPKSEAANSIPLLPSGIPEFINAGVNKKAPQMNAFTAPTHHLTLPRSMVVGQYFHKILYAAGMVSSKQEGFRIIVNNGASVGCMPSGAEQMGDALSFIPLRTWPADVTEKFIIDGSLLILRIGKWRVKIIKIISDKEFEEQGLTVPQSEPEPQPKTEEQKDRELFAKKRRIAGRQVQRPGIAGGSAGGRKPKIISLQEWSNQKEREEEAELEKERAKRQAWP